VRDGEGAWGQQSRLSWRFVEKSGQKSTMACAASCRHASYEMVQNVHQNQDSPNKESRLTGRLTHKTYTLLDPRTRRSVICAQQQGNSSVCVNQPTTK
jgi:hypothetical protein